jgi:hypothetical protein
MPKFTEEERLKWIEEHPIRKEVIAMREEDEKEKDEDMPLL